MDLSEQSLESKGRAAGVSVLLSILLFWSGVLSYVVGVSIVQTAAPHLLEVPALPFAISILTTNGGFLCIGYIYEKWSVEIRIDPLPDSKRIVTALTVVGFLIVSFAGVLDAYSRYTGILPEPAYQELFVQNELSILVVGLGMVVLVPISEEYVFRGMIQQRLRADYSNTAAIVITSVLFAFLHYANYNTTGGIVVGTTLIFVISIVFGILYERTDALAAPIIAHAVYNGIIYVAALISVWT